MSEMDKKKGAAAMDAFVLPHHHGQEQDGAQLHTQLLREDFCAVADMFRLLDDPSRLRIFWLLCHCEACVINLSALLEMTSPAVSHHLRQLKESGLITGRRAGREVYYKAADTAPGRMLHSAIEQMLDIACPRQASYPTGAVETVCRIHDELTAHPERRETIEELARRYLMNPTTLKTVFKDVYGESLAGHMKTHRLERGAQLLRTTADSVAQVAAAVGYASQSKFSAAFREAYGLLPAAYRKAHGAAGKAAPEE